MTPSKLIGALTCAAAALALTACGGGATANIGGTLSGLGSGLNLTLQNNYGDTLTLANNGAFTFATPLDGGATYSVTLLTPPVGQACTVANGSGVVDSIGDSVSSVVVACNTTSSIIGTVSGLAPGTAVTLSDGTVTLPVAANGPFAFPGTLSAGSAYAVTVTTPPAGQTCTVTNGTGTIPASGVTAISVACS